jgi:adenosine deaminase
MSLPTRFRSARIKTSRRLRLALLPLVISLLVGCRAGAPAQSSSLTAATASAVQCSLPNTAVADYTRVINSAPADLVQVMKAFPKGGDIHNHLSGTIMPEDYIAMGTLDNDCYGPASDDPAQLAIRVQSASGTCTSPDRPLSLIGSPDKLVRSLSMYQFTYPNIQAGHDQFFATFGRFGAVSGSDGDKGKMLAKVLLQADADSVSYVETMMSFQSTAVTNLANQLRQQFPDSAFSDFSKYAAMYAFLLDHDLKSKVLDAGNDLTNYVNQMMATLRCETSPKRPGCAVTYRFLSEVNRNAAINQRPDLAKMFTQTALSFLLTSSDPRVVGVNLVSGEDQPISMQSFAVQMKFFTYFHATFPTAKFALHGGELTPCFVGAGNPALFDHLTGSVNAGAKRLGHAISFAYLDEGQKAEVANLLRDRNILVEVPFTSNAQILGVAGEEHPFTQYFRKYGVPTSFATDDEGVSHSNYTSEWIYAFRKYRLQYAEAVNLARSSLQYSFLSGSPLWLNVPRAQLAAPCAGQTPGTPVAPGSACYTFLQGSAKASVQWDLEERLVRFYQTNGARLGQYLETSPK